MKRIKLTQRERMIFAAAVLTAGSFLIYYGLYLPLQRKSAVLEKKITRAREDLTSSLRTIREAKGMERKYKKILDVFRQTDSDEQVMSAMLSDIEDVAKQLGIHITEKKPEKPNNIEFYNSFSVNLAIDGKLSDIMHFIYVLQNAPHLYYVNDLNIMKKSPRIQDLQCRLVLSKILVPQM